MALSNLEFTKNWTDPEKFPTLVTSETQVREDMQALHDETKNFLNENLIPEVANELGMKATKDEVRGIVLGQIPDGTLTYDKLSAALKTELDDKATQEQVNDRYTKDEIWSAEIRGNFGLEESAVPADAMRQLSTLNLHTWLREAAEAKWEPVALESTAMVTLMSASKMSTTKEFDVSATVTADSTGKIIPVNPVRLALGYSKVDTLNAEYDLVGMYIQTVSTGVTYLLTSEFKKDTGEDTYLVTATARRVVSRELPPGDQTLVHSTDRTAHPDNDTVEGLHYTYLGVPMEKVYRGLRVQHGTYTGTGTNGADNPNRVELEFVPQMFIVMHPDYKALTNTDYGLIWIGQSGDGSTMLKAKFTVTGTTIEWYTSDVDAQLNTTGIVYHYFALG